MVGQWGPASAPASIGNVGVGFDILGQAFDAARDIVTAVRDEKPGARLMQVSGLVNSLPDTPAKNTALAAAQAVLSAAGTPAGLMAPVVRRSAVCLAVGRAAAPCQCPRSAAA